MSGKIQKTIVRSLFLPRDSPREKEIPAVGLERNLQLQRFRFRGIRKFAHDLFG